MIIDKNTNSIMWCCYSNLLDDYAYQLYLNTLDKNQVFIYGQELFMSFLTNGIIYDKFSPFYKEAKILLRKDKIKKINEINEKV